MSIRCSWRRGLSMVEVLVVLAIISVLTAVLLPTLSRARAQANRTRCLNNIRQIGNGVAIYIHDYKALPPQIPVPIAAPTEPTEPGPTTQPSPPTTTVLMPVFYTDPRNGLMSLFQTPGFEGFSLSCPDGWASGGNSALYDQAANPTALYMDYAYWGARYPPNENDVRSLSFRYRAQDKGTRILVTDVVTDLGPESSKLTATVGYGNHSSNHWGTDLSRVRMTDGRGNELKSHNVMRTIGSSVLFSDYHAEWFAPPRLTQQAAGLCYPPPDQWK